MTPKSQGPLLGGLDLVSCHVPTQSPDFGHSPQVTCRPPRSSDHSPASSSATGRETGSPGSQEGAAWIWAGAREQAPSVTRAPQGCTGHLLQPEPWGGRAVIPILETRKLRRREGGGGHTQPGQCWDWSQAASGAHVLLRARGRPRGPKMGGRLQDRVVRLCPARGTWLGGCNWG